jgi:DNA-directed RNA polymerase sigma subunit (sigma70/sigma32)
MSILKSPPKSPAPVNQSLTDMELISRVRMDNDSDAVVEITSRHTGIYRMIVGMYSNSGVNMRDVVEDMKLNIYKMTCSYDPNKGMQFGSYVGEQTKYICLNEIGKQIREGVQVPLSDEAYSDESEYEANDAALTYINRYSPQSNGDTTKEKDIRDISSVITDQAHDKRVIKIINLRHFNPDGKPATWRECGDAVGLSHEGARLLYKQFVEKMAKEFKEEIK